MKVLNGTSGRRRIYLLRHGHVDYASRLVVESQDPTLAELTEQGQLEARAAGVALSDIAFDIAISSGLKRTHHTAQIVLAANHAPPKLEIEERFQELHSGKYINFESREQLLAVLGFQFENAGTPGATFLEGGEKFSDAQIRIMEGLSDLLSRADWAPALVVAHEGTNRIALASSIGAPLGATAGFEQDTGCINILDFDLVKDENGVPQIERALIKSVNLTPANYVKNGMNLRSLEAIFSAQSDSQADAS